MSIEQEVCALLLFLSLTKTLHMWVLGPDSVDNDSKAREVKKQLVLVLVFCCSTLSLVEIKSKAQAWEGCDAWGGRTARHALYCHIPCFYFLCHIPWCLCNLYTSVVIFHVMSPIWIEMVKMKRREATEYIHLCCFISVKRLPWKLDYRAHISGHLCDY